MTQENMSVVKTVATRDFSILRCHTFHPRFNFLHESQSEKVIMHMCVIIQTRCQTGIRISIWQHTSVTLRLDFASLLFSSSRWSKGEEHYITDKAFNHNCFSHFHDLSSLLSETMWSIIHGVEM